MNRRRAGCACCAIEEAFTLSDPALIFTRSAVLLMASSVTGHC